MTFVFDNPVSRILVDATNINQWDSYFIEKFSQKNSLCGYDIETSNREAHEGIKKLMKIDDEGFSHGKKLIFDFKRTKITGASFYFGHTDGVQAFYVNFGHADVENCIDISYLFKWLDLSMQFSTST